jgi:hypothetical protein
VAIRQIFVAEQRYNTSMKFGISLFAAFLLASCAQSVLDPSELPGNGNGNGAADAVVYFVAFDQSSSDVSVESISLTGANRKRMLQSAYYTSAPAKGKLSIISPFGIELCALKDSGSRTGLAGPGMYLSATLSPQVQSVAYTVPTGNLANPTAGLYLIATDGTEILRLIDTSADPFIAPAFSPDGNQLAYVKKGEYPYSFDSLMIYSLNSYMRNGIYAYQFSGLRQDIELEWTPDGRNVLVIDDNYGAGISVKLINVSSGLEDPIIPNDPMLSYSYPTISSDGTKLALAKLDYRDGKSSLVVFTMQGQEIASTQLIDESIVMPCFSPDGQNVAYSVVEGIFIPMDFLSNTAQMATAKIELFTIATRATTTLVAGGVLRPVFER